MAKHDVPEHPRMLVALDSFSVHFEGSEHAFSVGDPVEEGARILKGIEHLFGPLEARYKADRPGVKHEKIEQATAAPGELRGE